MDKLRQGRIAVAAILGTLALAAVLLAQGTSQLLASALLPLDLSSPTPARRAPQARATAPAGHTRRDPMVVLRRNIFDSVTGPLDGREAVAAATPEATAEAQAFDPNAPVRACEAGAAKLVAAIVNERRPDWSFAAITVSSETLLYRAGMQVGGKEVLGIGSQRVYLREGSGPCSLAMFQPLATGGDTGGGPAPPPAPTPAPDEPPTPGGSDPNEAEYDANITRVSDTRYNINRSLVDRLLQDRASFIRQARVIPHEENGRIVGVKLYGIRRSGLLGKLGLQNGDMLRTINGYDMTSPDSALEAYARLRTANNLSLSLVRRGENVNMEFNIQ